MKNDKNLTAIAFILFVFSILYSGNLKGDGAKSFSENGVNVTVEKAEDTIKGFKAFKVTAKNNSGARRTLNSAIYLQNSAAKQPRGGSGSCTVYIELNTAEEKSEIKQCRETAESNDWIFEIVKVYNF